GEISSRRTGQIRRTVCRLELGRQPHSGQRRGYGRARAEIARPGHRPRSSRRKLYSASRHDIALMSWRFSYSLKRVGHPIVQLGGRWVRPRHVVRITLIGAKGSRARDALLDTGADDRVFPDELAAKIGVDLTLAPSGFGTGAGMGTIP